MEFDVRNPLLPLIMICSSSILLAGKNDRPSHFTAGELKTSGQACPNGSAQGGVGFNDSYGITFVTEKTEAVASDLNSEDKKNCQFEVTLTPHEGYQMRVDSFLINGWHITEDSAETSVDTLYSLYKHDELLGLPTRLFLKPKYPAPIDGVVNSRGFGNKEGDFEIVWQPKQELWTACGEPIVLRGSLDLAAKRHDSPHSAEIALHTTAAHTQSQLLWNWQTQTCQKPLPPIQEPIQQDDSIQQSASFDSSHLEEGSWQTYIVGFDTLPMPATIIFKGNKGYLKTSQFIGKLSRVTIKNNVVRGRWKKNLLTKGWFEFTFSDSNHFAGHFGYGRKIKNSAGTWYGWKN